MVFSLMGTSTWWSSDRAQLLRLPWSWLVMLSASGCTLGAGAGDFKQGDLRTLEEPPTFADVATLMERIESYADEGGDLGLLAVFIDAPEQQRYDINGDGALDCSHACVVSAYLASVAPRLQSMHFLLPGGDGDRLDSELEALRELSSALEDFVGRRGIGPAYLAIPASLQSSSRVEDVFGQFSRGHESVAQARALWRTNLAGNAQAQAFLKRLEVGDAVDALSAHGSCVVVATGNAGPSWLNWYAFNVSGINTSSMRHERCNGVAERYPQNSDALADAPVKVASPAFVREGACSAGSDWSDCASIEFVPGASTRFRVPGGAREPRIRDYVGKRLDELPGLRPLQALLLAMALDAGWTQEKTEAYMAYAGRHHLYADPEGPDAWFSVDPDSERVSFDPDGTGCPEGDRSGPREVIADLYGGSSWSVPHAIGRLHMAGIRCSDHSPSVARQYLNDGTLYASHR